MGVRLRPGLKSLERVSKHENVQSTRRLSEARALEDDITAILELLMDTPELGST